MTKTKSYTNWPLKKLLSKHHLNLTQFANLLSVSPASVRNFMYGSNAPSFSLMYKMMVAFELTSKEIMEIFFTNEVETELLPHINSNLQEYEIGVALTKDVEESQLREEKFEVNYGN